MDEQAARWIGTFNPLAHDRRIARRTAAA